MLRDAGAAGPFQMDALLEDAGIDQAVLDALHTVGDIHYAWVVLCR